MRCGISTPPMSANGTAGPYVGVNRVGCHVERAKSTEDEDGGAKIGLHSDGRDGQNVTDHRPTPGSKQGRDAILDQNCTQQSSTAYSPYPTEQTLTKLPLKLGKEPLIEALFEMRFKATAPVSNILPGLLFTKFKGEKKIEKLPAAQLPEELRKVDPSLHYAPLLRFIGTAS